LPTIAGAAREISLAIGALQVGGYGRRISLTRRQKKGGHGKKERHCCSDERPRIGCAGAPMVPTRT
jgi:hypothetical protein